jgi:hypothetical protein
MGRMGFWVHGKGFAGRRCGGYMGKGLQDDGAGRRYIGLVLGVMGSSYGGHLI